MFRICHIPTLRETRTCCFPDRYRSALNTNRCPKESSRRDFRLHRLNRSRLLSLSGDLLDAQGDFQAIPLPARSSPATMSTSTNPTAASSAEYAEVSPHRLDPLFRSSDRFSLTLSCFLLLYSCSIFPILLRFPVCCMTNNTFSVQSAI
jgi:hypothetical protein